MEQVLPSDLPEGTNPADTLTLDSWLQSSERMNFCYFKPENS